MNYNNSQNNGFIYNVYTSKNNMAGVNLDSMICREDFTFEGDNTQNTGNQTSSLRLVDLDDQSFMFNALRKPDFQRETNEWDPKKTCEFIESFVSGNLIPAVIFWNKPNSNTFVIDGSHRLSALAAWVNDDYGDGAISKKFYDGTIPEEQIHIAEQTRSLIRKKFGTYKDHTLAIKEPQKVSESIVDRSKSIAFLTLIIQWVQGNEESAEKSFFKINQSSQPLNKTEIVLLKNRKKPNVLTARAIMNGGKGHNYWEKFDKDKQSQIIILAEELFCALFRPTPQKPIKSIEKISIGGRLGHANTLPLIWSFVNIVNNTSNTGNIQDDKAGDDTIKYLTKCKNLIEKMNSNHPASLGLHPVVYFYSSDGRHKTASFYAIIKFLDGLNTKEEKNAFIKVRSKFESILLQYDYLVQQIVKKYRGADKSYIYISNFYRLIISKLNTGNDVADTITQIVQTTDFDFLIIRKEIDADRHHYESDGFSNSTKSKIFIKNALDSALKCNICKGYIHNSSISFDHVKRKADGGSNSPNNGKLTHPYCNTVYKN